MLHDAGNPYLDWILALRAGEPALDLTDSGLRNRLDEARPEAAIVSPAEGRVVREALREELAAHYGRPGTELTETLGASGAIFEVYAAHQEPGAAVLVEEPAYGPLVAVPGALGLRVDRFPRRREDGYRVDPDRVLAALTPETRLVAVTDTHNPSGRAAGDDALGVLAAALASRGVALFVDEAYRDFRDVRVGTARGLGDTVIAASTLTKVYGFGELRYGWVFASPAVTDRLRRIRRLQHVEQPWPSVPYALGAVRRLDVLRADSRRRAAEAWDRFAGWCADAGLPVPRCDGGIHAWLACPSGVTGTALAGRLLREHGVAVVPGRFFGEDDHVRVGIGARPDRLERGLDALGSVLSDMTPA